MNTIAAVVRMFYNRNCVGKGTGCILCQWNSVGSTLTHIAERIIAAVVQHSPENNTLISTIIRLLYQVAVDVDLLFIVPGFKLVSSLRESHCRGTSNRFSFHKVSGHRSLVAPRNGDRESHCAVLRRGEGGVCAEYLVVADPGRGRLVILYVIPDQLALHMLIVEGDFFLLVCRHTLVVRPQHVVHCAGGLCAVGGIIDILCPVDFQNTDGMDLHAAHLGVDKGVIFTILIDFLRRSAFQVAGGDFGFIVRIFPILRNQRRLTRVIQVGVIAGVFVFKSCLADEVQPFGIDICVRIYRIRADLHGFTIGHHCHSLGRGAYTVCRHCHACHRQTHRQRQHECKKAIEP